MRRKKGNVTADVFFTNRLKTNCSEEMCAEACRALRTAMMVYLMEVQRAPPAG